VASALDNYLDLLFDTYPPGFDLTLDRISNLLEKLDNPQRQLPPVIHVAGTNGKGSTAAFLHAIVEAAGLRCHTHTSPHLVRYNERYRLAGVPGGALVSDDELLETLQLIVAASNDQPITVFEILTSAVFVLFAKHPADLAVIEVGLGGRFDATNVITDPLASVITTIALDHQHYLGDTAEEIAFEKAGIIKPGRPVFLGPQSHDIRPVVEQVAAKQRAPIYIAGQEFMAYEEHGRLIYQDEHGLLDLPLPGLTGKHQIDNAGTAIAALRYSGLEIPEQAYSKGLSQVEWPGRLQLLRRGALLSLCPPGTELWIDGGHNPNAGDAISHVFQIAQKRNPRPFFLIAGMLNTKDPRGYFEAFADLPAQAYTVEINSSDAGISSDELAKLATGYGYPVTSAGQIKAALQQISDLNLSEHPRILIGGSLYLAGDALDQNGTPPGN
jgi:dihydrofolate synthase/folylpolyglutamate synthase